MLTSVSEISLGKNVIFIGNLLQTFFPTVDLTGKDYIDFDRMVLAKQLEQTVGELHWVTRIHKKVQEEKNILEKKLFESEKNAKVQQQHIDELKVLLFSSFL